jgi:hypothetical protein
MEDLSGRSNINRSHWRLWIQKNPLDPENKVLVHSSRAHPFGILIEMYPSLCWTMEVVKPPCLNSRRTYHIVHGRDAEITPKFYQIEIRSLNARILQDDWVVKCLGKAPGDQVHECHFFIWTWDLIHKTRVRIIPKAIVRQPPNNTLLEIKVLWKTFKYFSPTQKKEKKKFF